MRPRLALLGDTRLHLARAHPGVPLLRQGEGEPMTLSKAIKARMCGGCSTRVVTRAEFLDWVAQAEDLERKYLELHEEYGRLGRENDELRDLRAAIEDEVRRLAYLDDEEKYEDYHRVTEVGSQRAQLARLRALTEEKNDD